MTDADVERRGSPRDRDAEPRDRAAEDRRRARPYATVNPFTGETEKEFPFLETGEIDGVDRDGPRRLPEWRRRPVEERAQIVGRAAELMLERKDEFAALVTREMGKRIQEAAGEVQLAASILDYYAKNGPRFLEPRQIEVMKGEAVVENEPIGVILAIEPWNYPLYQVVRVAGPNLVLGNAILLKHAELNPQTALAIEKCFLDAGVPEGVYTNVFLRHPRRRAGHRRTRCVQGVTLTGSERAGSAVASLAGKHLKKSVLELGGSDPFIVLDTEDLGRTVKAATMGRMQNSGQACIAAKRLIVPEDIYEPFVEGLKQAFSTFSPGDPSDPSTTLAPLSSEQAAKDLHAQIQDAIDKGATVVTGGGRPDHAGRVRRADDPHRRHPGDAGLLARSCSARPPSSTRSRTRTRRSSWPTTARTASAPPSSPATSTRRGRWPTGSRPAWCSSTSRPAPPPSCPSAA